MYGYIPGDNRKKGNTWSATGTQFAVPYVFKTLFSHEPITLADMTETKSVKSAIYLNFNETGEDNLNFVGKVGAFTPVKPGMGGGLLVREGYDKDGNVKYDAVTGTKGYRWVNSECLTDNDTPMIDKTYYQTLVDDAVESIAKYGDAEAFIE